MNKKQIKILFLGGSYAQIPIIQEAKSRGYYTIICDYLSDNPGQKIADEYHNVSTTDFEAVLKLAKKLKPNLVLAYASDPAAPTAAYVSEKLGLPGNSYESVRILGEKDLFRGFLKKNGFNVPWTITVVSVDEAEKLKNCKYPCIVKPTDSSGSKGVTKVENAKELEKAIEYALGFSRNGRVIIEEFIDTEGQQIHGDGFVVDGRLQFSFLGDHHYDKLINPFVPYSTTWPSRNLVEDIENVQREVDKIIALVGFKNGAINIEARINRDKKIFIMEIGPRSGGNFVPQVINYATGFDMVEKTLDVFVEDKFELDNFNTSFAAYYVIHSGISGELQKLKISDLVKPFVKEFHQYIKEGDQVKSFQGANAAIGILLLTFPNSKEMDYYIKNMEKFINLEVA